MNIPTREELRMLVESEGGRHVSIFIPTDQTGINSQHDRVQFKNMMRDTEEELASMGDRQPDITSLLAPACELLENSQFWRHQSDGMAVFVAPEKFFTYQVPKRFAPHLVINRRFQIKPLLPLLNGDGHFYVLALSMNKVRFFEGSQYGVCEINVQDMPKSLADAIKYDEFERQLQFHTDASAPNTQGERSAMYYGTGAGDLDEKNLIWRYFSGVNDGIIDYLSESRDPLVLAGVDYLHAIYRDANHYRYLLEKGVMGSPDNWSGEELHRKAWPIVEPEFTRTETAAITLYRRFRGEGDKRAVDDLKTIISASYFGRVDSLFVREGAEAWGHFDAGADTVDLHATRQQGDEDLLDLAAAHAFINSGAVYSLDGSQMPTGKACGALLRY